MKSHAERQARYRQRQKTRTTELLARIKELEKALASARRDTSVVQVDSEQQSGGLPRVWRKPSPHERRIKQLEAKVRELQALVLPLDDSQKDALRQHKRKFNREFKARCRQYEIFIRQHGQNMNSKDYSLFLAGMHPDASVEMRDKARNRLEEKYEKQVTDMDKFKFKRL